MIGDFPISTNILFKLLIKLREEEHVEVLNQFAKGEALESLSREDLETKLEKSLNIKVTGVARLFGGGLERVSLIRLAHFAIGEANRLLGKPQTKRKGMGEDAGSKRKKDKAEDTTVQ